MTDTRRDKVAANIMTTVAQMLQGRIKDPRLGFVTVTSVEVTGQDEAEFEDDFETSDESDDGFEEVDMDLVIPDRD